MTRAADRPGSQVVGPDPSAGSDPSAGPDRSAGLNRDLAELPSELRWRDWRNRIEVVLFASAAPVARTDLARVMGPGASVDLLIDDLRATLVD